MINKILLLAGENYNVSPGVLRFFYSSLGANPNNKYEEQDGNTFLQAFAPHTSHYGDYEQRLFQCLEISLVYGFDINQMNYIGEPILMTMVKRQKSSDEERIQLRNRFIARLLQVGAQVNMGDYGGAAHFFVSSIPSQATTTTKRRRKKIPAYLISAGGDLKMVNKHGETVTEAIQRKCLNL